MVPRHYFMNSNTDYRYVLSIQYLGTTVVLVLILGQVLVSCNCEYRYTYRTLFIALLSSMEVRLY